MKRKSEDGRCRLLKSYEVREIEKGHAQEKNRREARSPMRENQVSAEHKFQMRRNT